MTEKINTLHQEYKEARSNDGREDSTRSIGLHHSTLFDHDADLAGQYIDEATGEEIADHPNTNADSVTMDGLTVLTTDELEQHELAGYASDNTLTAKQVQLERDADDFLRQKDPEHPLYGTDPDLDPDPDNN